MAACAAHPLSFIVRAALGKIRTIDLAQPSNGGFAVLFVADLGFRDDALFPA
jgi:hypothetical protein